MIDIIALIICLICIYLGGYFIIRGWTLDNDKFSLFIGATIIFMVILYAFVFHSDNTQYVPAEPLAHNKTQTVFTTDKGTYTVDGLYPNGTYMLTVDGDNVLVVWQAVEGIEEGLG